MIKLCFSLILCLLFPNIQAMSEEMEELAKQLHNDCVEQIGDAAVEAFITTVQKKEGFPDENLLKCYIKCVMDEMAIVDDDGVIDVEAAIALLPEEMADDAAPIMRKCGVIKGSSPCDTVYQTHKCYYDTNKEVYFLV
ncbi:general odorant-binding protein 69a-like [Onthophagus taurus]|uniref:general odorant-binding protein 69a-like n=1 Tax=Onthophagus taurus TaxID=166361 RepID=UPI000C20CD48|nr:general odorant-binding protein 69a-like [Onthophagus taurus]